MTSLKIQTEGILKDQPAQPDISPDRVHAIVRKDALTDPSVNILIVDDEPKNLAVLEAVLDDPGYRLVRAASGNEALLALMADEFAVLVLDVQMPDMTGFELAQMVKERKKTARVPIIFLTAYYNEDQHILEGYVSGAVDYLHKPVNASVLRSKVFIFAELYRTSRALKLANSALLSEVHERRIAESRLSELNETLDRHVTQRTHALHASEALLREAASRKDEFLATLAHELRNPLAPLRNASHALRMKSFSMSKLQSAAQVIDRQVSAMSRLIDDLMDVSRINQGKIELRLAYVELEEVLHDAIDSSRPLIDECGHTLVLSPLHNKVLVEGDAIRLTQVFTNLLNNAAKYMDRGGNIEVTVSQGRDEVLVAVRDAGIGIALERLEDVFELFSQVETALSRSRGGLGIGLSLSRRLVEMHRGSIEVHSMGLGHGSEFVVRLPLISTPHNEMVIEPEPSQSACEIAVEAPETHRELRILVADDNKDSASTLTMVLEMMGHSVRQVHDGEAAVTQATAFDPHLIFLDIGMPKLHGYEACRQIRAKPGGAARTVVAITGWGQPSDRAMSQQSGFDQHLVKPVELSQLDTVIAKLTQQAPWP